MHISANTACAAVFKVLSRWDGLSREFLVDIILPHLEQITILHMPVSAESYSNLPTTQIKVAKHVHTTPASW